jgi:hypothetical protein
MEDQTYLKDEKKQVSGLTPGGSGGPLLMVKGSTWTRFVDGAISGLVSGAILQPLQVIKTSMQISPIDKPTDKQHQSRAFKKIMSRASH